MMQPENHMSQPCLTVPVYKNIRVYSTLIDKNLPPDGSNDAFRILFAFIVHYKTSSGARPALPMGVAPEAIAEKSFFRV
jgi:hypothetical protein